MSLTMLKYLQENIQIEIFKIEFAALAHCFKFVLVL